jgi:hypothetical protein
LIGGATSTRVSQRLALQECVCRAPCRRAEPALRARRPVISHDCFAGPVLGLWARAFCSPGLVLHSPPPPPSPRRRAEEPPPRTLRSTLIQRRGDGETPAVDKEAAGIATSPCIPRHPRAMSRTKPHPQPCPAGSGAGAGSSSPSGLGLGRRLHLLRRPAAGRPRVRPRQQRQVDLLPPPHQLAAPQVGGRRNPNPPGSITTATCHAVYLTGVGLQVREGRVLGHRHRAAGVLAARLPLCTRRRRSYCR